MYCFKSFQVDQSKTLKQEFLKFEKISKLRTIQSMDEIFYYK